MKNILLATDLASNSDRAMGRAIKIAKEQKAKLHIVHIAPPYTGPKSKKWVLDLQKETEDLIQGYLYDYKDSAEVDIETIVKQDGEVFFGVLEAAYANKVDLIIAGMHGKEKLRDLFVGTTIERIIRKGIKPVLIVKNKPIGPYKSIMSAVDFAPGSREALRIAIELAPKAVFHIVHAVMVPIVSLPAHDGDSFVYQHMREQAENNAKRNMEAFLKTEVCHFAKTHNDKEKRLSGMLLEGSVPDALIKKAKNMKADLITIGTHSQLGLIPKLGGVAGDILSKPPCDILVAMEKIR